jgi:hypothetical protein
MDTTSFPDAQRSLAQDRFLLDSQLRGTDDALPTIALLQVAFELTNQSARFLIFLQPPGIDDKESLTGM